jgi:hypothetical protein
MEEAVWISFAIISIILAFGIIGKIVAENREDSKFAAFEASIGLIKSQCNYVCASPEDTYLPVDVELPSGIIVSANYADKKKICAEFRNESKCGICNCEVEPYILNLTSKEAEKTFVKHSYKCYFERLTQNVRISCKG